MNVVVSAMAGWPPPAKGDIGLIGSYGAWDVTLAALGGGALVILLVAVVGIALIPLLLVVARQVGSSTRHVGYSGWSGTSFSHHFPARISPSGNAEKNGERKWMYEGGEGMSPELQELRFLLVRMDERLSTVERHSEEGRETLKVLVERVTPRSRTTRKQSRDE